MNSNRCYCVAPYKTVSEDQLITGAVSYQLSKSHVIGSFGARSESGSGQAGGDGVLLKWKAVVIVTVVIVNVMIVTVVIATVVIVML